MSDRSEEFTELNIKFFVNSIYNYMMITEPIEIISCINSKIKDTEFQKAIFYYGWLFRKESKFIECLNHPVLESKIIVDYLFYCFGKSISRGEDPEDAMFVVCENLKSETCFRILKQFDLMGIDTNFALTLVSKLNSENFEEIANQNDLYSFFQNIFQELSPAQIKKYFMNNPEIYNYMIRVYGESGEIESYEKFLNKYEKDISIILQASLIKEKILEFQNSNKNSSSMNKDKINLILNELKKNQNAIEILNILSVQEGCFDEMEKKTLEYLLNFREPPAQNANSITELE